MSRSPGVFEHMEGWIRAGVEWLRLGIETLSALVIAVGVGLAMVGLFRHVLTERGERFLAIRLQLARYLTLALEFQLAADILSTSVSPTWDGIGKLAAIAVIRTALNYFINLEMKEEQRRLDERNASALPAAGCSARAGNDR